MVHLFFFFFFFFFEKTSFLFQLAFYGKCPKILYNKVSDRMAYANSVDSDQTASEGAI